MINLFQVAPNDASLAYLSQLFGNVNGVLCRMQNGTCVPLGGTDNVLSTMFATFNQTILTIAVIMLVYITVLGVIGTAHEGEFMGKKMNNIWIPIRAVMGIALLVPTGSGYCGIQIIMMWIIVQGVGAADNIWETAVRFATTKGTYAQTSVPVIGANRTFGGVFRGLTCYITSKQGEVPKFDQQRAAYNLNTCGTLTYCNQGTETVDGIEPSCKDPNSVSCQACKIQVNALTDIIPTLANIANSLVAADTSYKSFREESWGSTNNRDWQWIYSYCADKGINRDECCVRGNNAPVTSTCKSPYREQQDIDKIFPPLDDPNQTGASDRAVKTLYYPYYRGLEPTIGQGVNFIQVAVGLYQDMANGLISAIIEKQKETSAATGNAVVDANLKNGWIFAGALYYQLANMNSSNLKDSSNISEMKWTDSTTPPSGRNNLAAADFLVQIASGDASIGNPSVGGGVGGEANDVTNTLGDAFKTNIGTDTTNAGQTNPLLMLQIFGMVMLIIVQIIFVIVIALIIIMGVTSTVGSLMVLGTGLNDAGSTLGIMMAVFIVPAFWALMGILVSVGALLAIYTPLLPFIYFTFGALAWMISTIEAMVAGPLVALGIISPSGQHEIMGKAEPAILLLFGIFLRPTLMIFGLMAAMLLAITACNLVNATFAVVMLGWVAYDPLSLIFVLVAYVSLILAVLNQCFKVINLIPQQVMRWIGGQGDAVDTPTQEIKGGIDAGVGRASGGAEGTGGRMNEGGQRTQHQAERDEDANRQQNISSKGGGGTGGGSGGGTGGGSGGDSGSSSSGSGGSSGSGSGGGGISRSSSGSSSSGKGTDNLPVSGSSNPGKKPSGGGSGKGGGAPSSGSGSGSSSGSGSGSSGGGGSGGGLGGGLGGGSISGE